MTIDRCVCFQTTFAELKTIAEATGPDDLEALQDHAVFGLCCTLCHPYVRRMLETGETTFDDLLPHTSPTL